MKIDTALKSFTETYDENAIKSIENISQDLGLRDKGITIKVFNMKESFDNFKEIIGGFTEYKINNQGTENADISNKVFEERIGKFIEDELFKECNITYPDLPSFVESYISGIKMLLSLTDETKDKLMEGGIDYDTVGLINNFMESFVTRLDESFSKTMQRILWASGYNSQRALFGSSSRVSKPIFL